jgi:AraC-like DNA-binding protein
MTLAACAEQRLAPATLPRHRHAEAYAAVVLDGGYVEAGDLGCWRAEPGDVLVHRAFEAHQNTVDRGGARVLNLPLTADIAVPPAFRAHDIDAVIRAARRDPAAAAASLSVEGVLAPVVRSWPDLLAAALREDPDLSLGPWARRNGLAAATVSRGFAAAFGVTPARYRAEARALAAWRRIRTGGEPLAAIAYEGGFADQAHMSRAIVALTGAPPRAWSPVKTVQDAVRAPA